MNTYKFWAFNGVDCKYEVIELIMLQFGGKISNFPLNSYVSPSSTILRTDEEKELMWHSPYVIGSERAGCQIRYNFRLWPLYRHPYTFQHFFLISCIFVLTSLHYNCSILHLLTLHISSSIFFHLLTFSSFFSINIRTPSSASVP